MRWVFGMVVGLICGIGFAQEYDAEKLMNSCLQHSSIGECAEAIASKNMCDRVDIGINDPGLSSQRTVVVIDSCSSTEGKPGDKQRFGDYICWKDEELQQSICEYMPVEKGTPCACCKSGTCA